MSFGKRTTPPADEGEGSISNVIQWAIGIAVLIILFIAGCEIFTQGILAFPFFSLPDKINPFITTRKMRIPPHSRIGHRERLYRQVSVFLLRVAFIALLLALFTIALQTR